MVHSVIYDPKQGRATGVRVIDAQTMEAMEFQARVVFLCASALESTRILLHSTSPEFPTGLANSSGQLGRNLMDHVMGGGARGTIPGYESEWIYGNRPNGIYLPRFRNVTKAHPGLPPRIRLPGRRRPQRLGAGQLDAGDGQGVQGVAPGAGAVALQLLRLRRVPAQSRQLRRARSRS